MSGSSRNCCANNATPDVWVLLSGGLDSTCCLAFYLELGRSIEAIHVDYGQPAAEQELLAAERLAVHYSIGLRKVSWNGLEKKTVGSIPGRNAFFVISALMEKPDSVRTIVLGIHAGTTYSDCSRDFIRSLSGVLDHYAHPRVSIGVPFIEWRKADIFAYSQSRSIPIDLTYSCELGGARPCGSCVSCVDRQELITNAG